MVAYQMAECAACGTAEEMLFACRHCERRFCGAHVSDHECDDGGMSEAATTSESGEEPDVDAGRLVGAATGEIAHTGGQTGGQTMDATHSPTMAASVTPDVRVESRSHPAGTKEETPVRLMDVRRPPEATTPHRPETVWEWLHQQTYLTLIVKVGGIAVLLSIAFYTAMLILLYDPLGVL